MNLDDFDYELPVNFIAQDPVEPRDAARLLVFFRKDNHVEHRTFRNLPNYLHRGDVLVLNNTRVLPVRLFGVKPGRNSRIEFLLLKNLGGDRWEVLVRPGKKIKPGDHLYLGEGTLRARVESFTKAGGRVVTFFYKGDFEEVLNELGEMPLPPYIKSQPEDPQRYQTIYARFGGSAAAPTAGLHFTSRLLQELREQGVDLVFLLLHVGLGTFRPVRTKIIEEHHMHAEYYCLGSKEAQKINEARSRGGRVVAVGTTVARVLETVAGSEGRVKAGSGWTDLFIYPGYQFKAVDILITNFHLPCSSLLMLVSAFAGREKVLRAYEIAKRENYRFFSFGDAMLII